MSFLDTARTRFPALNYRVSPSLTVYQWAFVAIMIAALLTRLWRLNTPDECYFDEVYFPTTGAEILHGDTNAWNFFGHENTHPPLSKEIMALGEGIFGNEVRSTENKCWTDEEDKAHRTDAGWTYQAYSWRFFGAVAGVLAVFFMYFLAKRLFGSEVAGLAAALLLTCDGLAFAQSRIGTPDTYVLCFMLASVYFLVSNRLLFSGIAFGAAAASKWNGVLTAVPIVLYFTWRLLAGIRDDREAPERKPLSPHELAIPGGLMAFYAGIALTLWRFVSTESDVTYELLGGPVQVFAVLLIVAGALAVAAGVISLRQQPPGRGAAYTPLGKLFLQIAVGLGVFFVLVPGYVYLMTYLPMLLNGHSLSDVADLNRMAYHFHSTLNTPHPYASLWDTWPIMGRPVYFYLDSADPDGTTKIYSLGNPIIFWMSLPALAFVAWQAFRHIRARVSAMGEFSISGLFADRQMPLLFVLFSYLGFWLPWAIRPRILFIYHYLPALAFAILALAYVVDWLWKRPDSRGRIAAISFLVAVVATFVYFYPHLAAVHVPVWLDQSYYWFNNRLLSWQ